MLIIHHRRNTINLVKETPFEYGIEIDIRSYQDQLIVNHEPYKSGIHLVELLKFYKHRFLILNVKEEGLEKEILNIMSKFRIKSFFFLDQSFPFLIKTIKSREKRCAIRISEYESIETPLSLSGLAEWIWIDIFNSFPISNYEYRKLKNAGFKLCLVSPELQQHPLEKIKELKQYLKEEKIQVDAVCTKEPLIWVAD